MGIGFLGHMSHSGDLLLWVDVRRRPLSVVHRLSSVESKHLLLMNYWANLHQIWYVVSLEIVNFITPPPPHNFEVKSVILMYFLKKSSLLRGMVQTKYIVIINKEGSIKIVNFISPGAGVLVAI